MENMLDKINKYQSDFKGSRIPIYEKKFIQTRISKIQQMETQEKNKVKKERRQRHEQEKEKKTVQKHRITVKPEKYTLKQELAKNLKNSKSRSVSKSKK